MDIHIFRDGEQLGPYTEDEVQALLKQGRVLISDLAWRPGLPEWLPLVQVIYPAGTLARPSPAPRTPAAPPATDPPTAKQKAFLSYMGVAFGPGTTRDDADRLVNDTLENPKEPALLARWNESRLVLHPDLFAPEIQARKENRPQRFLELCETEGAAYFEKVTRAHCQVLVRYLDVEFPNWDANERDAARNYFFPAIVEKFPQLAAPEAKEIFKYPDSPAMAGEFIHGSPIARKTRSSSALRQVAAFARGVFIGGLILGMVWLARIFIAKSGKADSATTAASAAPATPPPQPAAELAQKTPSDGTGPKPGSGSPAPRAATDADRTTAIGAEAKTAPATSDLPASGSAPRTEPVSLIPASPAARTSVILTKPVQIALAYGKVTVPPGTPVRIVQQNGSSLKVLYLDKVVTVPVSSTDLGTDPGPAAAPAPATTARAGSQ